MRKKRSEVCQDYFSMRRISVRKSVQEEIEGIGMLDGHHSTLVLDESCIIILMLAFVYSHILRSIFFFY